MTVQNGGIKFRMNFAQVGAHAWGGPFFTGEMSFERTLAAGVAAGQFDSAYIAERSVNASSNDDIDLNGVLVDALGATVSILKVVAIAIINRAKDGTVNTSTLTVGGGSNPVVGFVSSLVLKPNAGIILHSDDLAGLFAVTAATADILRVANGTGATNKYQIGILGRSS